MSSEFVEWLENNSLLLLSLPVCADYNHVRSWSVTRFRGMINTQPGSVPLASFKVMSFEDMDPPANYADGNNFGESLRRCLVSN